LKVFNSHGSLQFSGHTDLCNVNLAETVTIDVDGVEVYPDEEYALQGKGGKKVKPDVGTKLNKEAVIVLNNIDVPEGCGSATKANAYFT